MDINPALMGADLAARLAASEWTEGRAARLRDHLTKQEEAAAEDAIRARLDTIEAGKDDDAKTVRAAAFDRMTARLNASGDDGVWEELEAFWEDLGSAHRRVRDLEVSHKASYPALWLENALQAEQYHGEYCAYREWQDKQR